MTSVTSTPVDPEPPRVLAAPPWSSPRRLRVSGRPSAALLLPAGLAAAVALLPLVYLVVRATERGLGAVAEVLMQDRTVALVARAWRWPGRSQWCAWCSG